MTAVLILLGDGLMVIRAILKQPNLAGLWYFCDPETTVATVHFVGRLCRGIPYKPVTVEAISGMNS